METKGYSVWVGLRKVALQALIFGAPLIMQWLPENWMNLTVAGLLALVVNAAKFQLTK